jgi:hypothetical protein
MRSESGRRRGRNGYTQSGSGRGSNEGRDAGRVGDGKVGSGESESGSGESAGGRSGGDSRRSGGDSGGSRGDSRRSGGDNGRRERGRNEGESRSWGSDDGDDMIENECRNWRKTKIFPVVPHRAQTRLLWQIQQAT